jgi:hypothetical protein
MAVTNGAKTNLEAEEEPPAEEAADEKPPAEEAADEKPPAEEAAEEAADEKPPAEEAADEKPPADEAADEEQAADQQLAVPLVVEDGIEVNNTAALNQAVDNAKAEVLAAKKKLQNEVNDENKKIVMEKGSALVTAQMALAKANPTEAAAVAAAALEAADADTNSDPLRLDYLIKSIYSLTIEIKEGDENLNKTIVELQALVKKMNPITEPIDDMTILNLTQQFFLFSYITEMGEARQQQTSTNGANAAAADADDDNGEPVEDEVVARGGRYKSRRRRKKHNSRKTHKKKHRKTHKKKHRKTRKTHKKKHRKNYRTRKM